MINDSAEFDKETLQRIADNLRRPGGRAPGPKHTPPSPMPASVPEAPTVATPQFIFGTKSQKLLRVVCDLVNFYETIERSLTAENVK